jgi:dihydrofolate reductase
MKTVYYTATSLDGYIATEDDGVDWLFPLGDVNDTSYASFIADIGALAMGSSTYQWMLRHLQSATTEAEGQWPYSQPTWVFSHRELPRFPGVELNFVRGDVRPIHAAMCQAAAGKNVWIVGGGDLAGQFFDAGLLDEMVVQVASVTLGSGKRLFPRRVTSPALQLMSVRQMGPGLAELHYVMPKS